jgi:hypothetical protein
MHFLVHKPNPVVTAVLASVIAAVIVTFLVLAEYSAQAATAPASCSGVNVQFGSDLDAIVNRDPGTTATTFCLASGKYVINNTLLLKNGDKLVGPQGEVVKRGPASYGVPTAKIVGSGVEQIISPRGSNITIRWVDISNSRAQGTTTGTGIGIAAANADGTLLVQYSRIHNNDAVGISNAKGRIVHNEFFSNMEDPSFFEFNGSAVKGIAEFEAAYNYVHDEQGHGLWCSNGCANDPLRANGAWFHHNVTVNNRGWGLRYEVSPMIPSGTHSSQPTFLAEYNRSAGNDLGAASIRDAQNGTYRNNIFGPQTIAGVSYPRDGNNGLGLFMTDSGKSTRTDLYNADAINNTLNGERIVGCEQPDRIVFCSGN